MIVPIFYLEKNLCIYQPYEIRGVLNNAAVGAAIGSFSAFVLGLIAYDYTKKRERWNEHNKAVVRYEGLLNRHLNAITGNIFLLKGSIETFKKSAFSENVLAPLDNYDYTIDLLNLQLLNVYQDYESLLEKVNHDMAGWNRSNERLFNVALSGRVPLEDIEINRKELSKRSTEIIHHLEDLMEETYTTLAYIRKFISIDRRDRFGRLEPTRSIKLTDKEIGTERKALIRESNATMEKDKKRTNKYASYDQ